MTCERQRIPNFPAIALCGLLLSVVATAASAQQLPEWRYYTSQDGLNNSWVFCMTARSHGTIWLTHGDVGKLTAYDGRSFWTIPSPGYRNKVYESPTGLLWSIGAAQPDSVTWSMHSEQPRSVCIYQDGKWKEVAQLTGTAFFPLSGSTLLFIQEGRLCEFSADNRETRVLLQPERTSIGRFINLLGSHDGSAWIIADRGVLKFPPSQSGDNSQSQWTEYPIPEELEVRGLLQPLEGPGGKLLAVSTSLETGKRVLVEFDGQSWQIVNLVPEWEDLFAAWRGDDGTL